MSLLSDLLGGNLGQGPNSIPCSTGERGATVVLWYQSLTDRSVADMGRRGLQSFSWQQDHLHAGLRNMHICQGDVASRKLHLQGIIGLLCRSLPVGSRASATDYSNMQTTWKWAYHGAACHHNIKEGLWWFCHADTHGLEVAATVVVATWLADNARPSWHMHGMSALHHW